MIRDNLTAVFIDPASAGFFISKSKIQGDLMKTKSYPEIGFLRLRDMIGAGDNPDGIPVSRSSWYKGIAEGRYPKPVKLGERTSA